MNDGGLKCKSEGKEVLDDINRCHEPPNNYYQVLFFKTAWKDSFNCDDLSFGSSEHVSKKCVPTQTQIRQQMGPKLSEVFFEYVGNEGKAYLGLEPPLEGPDIMWISPDARLKNDVRVTPVPDPKGLQLKVFTHETILELGQEYIEKLKYQCRFEMEEALKKQAQEMEQTCLRRMDALVMANNEEKKLHCKKVVATLMEHFDKCFNDLANTMRLRLRKEYQLRAEEERAEVASYMLSIMQDEIQNRDLELCEQFHDILYGELNVLASRYIKQINEEREVAVTLIRETVQNYEKMLQDMKIELEMNNVVDVCQAITQERVACRETTKELTNQARKKENEFLKFAKKLEAENRTLRKMATERLKRLMQWKSKVREILLEFQRYINFAMKSVPGQSEFMLNMEKLLLKNYPEDSFLQPEDYEHFQNCLKGRAPPSPTDDKETPEQEGPCEYSTVEEETVVEEREASTPSYCSQEEAKHPLAFDFDQFKEMLKQKYAADLINIKPETVSKKAVCLWKKKTQEVAINKSCELYKMMTLAGENEKEHLAPLNCFMNGRLRAVRKICEEDPEFATALLGCSDK